MKIGTIAGGVGTATTISIQYVPQYIYLVSATTMTSIKVNVNGDGVIFDLDTKGLNAFSAIRTVGRKTSSFLHPLADGIIKGKNTDITVVNSVAGAIDLYGFSEQEGRIYCQSMRQKILAGSGANIKGFAFLGIPDIATGDTTTFNYASGFTQRMDQVELLAYYEMYQNDVNTNAYGLIDNFAAKIKSIDFTPAADETIYMLRFAPVGQVSSSIF